MNLLEALDNDASGYGIILPLHQRAEEVPFIETTEEPKLSVMREAVGGWIEHVTLRYVIMQKYEDPSGDFEVHAMRECECDGVVNEEGKLMGLPFNPLASAWYGMAHHGDPIVGPMMVLIGAARMK